MRITIATFVLLCIAVTAIGGGVHCIFKGTVSPVEITYPDTLDFGMIDIGSEKTLEWVIKHGGPEGARPMEGDIVRGPLCSSDITFTTLHYSLEPGDSLIVPITARPLTTGIQICDISNVPSSP